MSNFLNAQRRGFVKGGAPAYKCRVCGHNTRPTGRGDNDHVKACEICYDLAGEENHYSDNGGTFYDKPENVLAMIETLEKRGSDASDWQDMKKNAQALIAAKGN